MRTEWLAVAAMVLAPLIPLTATAEGKNWKEITSAASKKICTHESPCRFKHAKGEWDFAFRVSKNTQDVTMIESLEITDVATKKSDIHFFKDLDGVFAGDYFRIYDLNLKNAGAPLIVAMQGYDTGRRGQFYVYFVYDTKAKKFVKNEELFPTLEPVASKGSLLLTDGEKQFIVDKFLSIKPR